MLQPSGWSGPEFSRKDNGTLSPNPDNLTSEAAIITSAAAGTADRVIAYFDKEVNAEDFMKDGHPDFSKFECTVKTGLDSLFTDTDNQELRRTVIAVLPVANETKALEILVNRPMIDNANASIQFKDKRANSGMDTSNTVNFRLADAREPSVLAVGADGTKKIEITFSEAVLPRNFAGNDVTFAANNTANYLIDGRPLSDFGIPENGYDRGEEEASTESSELKRTEKVFDAPGSQGVNDGKVKVESYSVKDKTDNRHKVTITLGSNSSLPAGNHVLTVRNVGDWAAMTDKARNSVSTQALPFTVAENSEKPDFTVNIQSPEQYELNFNTEFRVADSSDRFGTLNSAKDASILQLQEYVNGAWTPISNDEAATGRNPVAVSRVGSDSTKYLVEVRRDWSDVYNFNSTRTDYYNKRLRLHVDAGKLVNTSNGLRNDEINIELNANDAKVTSGGEIMSGMDEKSPEIKNVEQAQAKNGTLLNSWNVEFTEPVKISSTANREGLTPSQRQQAGVNASSETKLRENQGVPVAFARFVNVNNPSIIVEGNVDETAFIDAEDTIINIEPEGSLSGGDWRLVVGSVSDDYGSTLATDSRVITIDEKAVVTDFKVVWAAVSETETYDESRMGNINPDKENGKHNQGSYVFVKFNKAVELGTALDENNYALNNQPLPQGASIQANIKGYDEKQDSVVDSVTIVLPTQSNLLYGAYTFDTLSTQLSINGVRSNIGEALTVGSGMTQLPYNIGESAAKTDYSSEQGVKVPGLLAKSDAVWGNDPSEQYDSTQSGYIKTWPEYYEALKTALNNDQYRRIEIQKEAFHDLKAKADDTQFKAAKSVFGKDLTININRAVDVDFKDAELDGNIAVSTTDTVDQMMISGVIIKGYRSSSKKGSASLTVNAGTVKDFVFNGTAIAGSNENAILINDAWSESFKLGSHASVEGTIYVNDANGFGFRNDSVWGQDGSLIINSNGVINLKGSFAGAHITLEQAATLNLGTAGASGEPVQLAGAVIDVRAAETKVMIRNAKGVLANKPAPIINIIGKDIKVYCADQKTEVSWLKNAGGSIITVNEDGKTDSDNVLNEQFKDNKGGMKKILDSLTIIPGAEGDTISYEDYLKITTGGAFVTSANTDGKLGINISTMQSEIYSSVINRAKENDYLLKNADGSEIGSKENDIKVTVSLADRSNAKIFEEKNGYIYPKTNAVTGRDTIVITVSYAGNDYTRSFKVTN